MKMARCMQDGKSYLIRSPYRLAMGESVLTPEQIEQAHQDRQRPDRQP